MLIRIDDEILINTEHLVSVRQGRDLSPTEPSCDITMTAGDRISFYGDVDRFIDVYNEHIDEESDDDAFPDNGILTMVTHDIDNRVVLCFTRAEALKIMNQIKMYLREGEK